MNPKPNYDIDPFTFDDFVDLGLAVTMTAGAFYVVFAPYFM